MSILVLGTVALDTVKTPHGLRKGLLGGSAAHFSMAARIFTQVHLVAVVGENFPCRYVDFLQEKGLDLTSLIRTKGKTFQWSGEYTGDLNTASTLGTELGVLLAFKPKISERQRSIKNIFLANIDPEIQEHLLSHIRSPRLVAMDSMNFWIENKRKSLLKLLKRIDIYVANDQEARSLSGQTNLVKAAKALSKYGPKMVLIKKGEHGVLFYDKDFIFSLPAYPVEDVVDPTGAGDTFAGGFMGYLAKVKRINQDSIRRALAYGTVAASFNIEDFGVGRTRRLRLGDLNKRLSQFKRHVSF